MCVPLTGRCLIATHITMAAQPKAVATHTHVGNGCCTCWGAHTDPPDCLPLPAALPPASEAAAANPAGWRLMEAAPAALGALSDRPGSAAACAADSGVSPH